MNYLNFLLEDKLKSGNIIIRKEIPTHIINEFGPLWVDHINYVNSIQNFPYKKASLKMFKEKLYKALKKYPKAHVLFTARDNDKLIGYVQVGIRDKHGHIISFHLLKEYRRKGIGGKLIKEAVNWLWNNGAKEIELGAQGGNEAAVAFYKKHGFEIEGYTLRHKKSKY